MVKKLLLVGLYFAASLGLGATFGHLWWPRVVSGNIVRENNDEYDFINPIIACEIAPKDNDFPELAPLDKQLQSVINQYLGTKRATSLSVYFRGLNRGRWLEINKTDQYRPASLLKVLVAIASYRYAEDHSGYLAQEVTFEKPQVIIPDQKLDPKEILRPGNIYTIRELIEHSLIYSDNEANNLLIDNLPAADLEHSAEELGVKLDEVNLLISPRIYSLLFRVLYNATYLDRHDSETLLSTLARSKFTAGLAPGVPKGLAIAHKFGVRNIKDISAPTARDSAQELHDCGIIYYPHHPYFLCVMTSGNDATTLAQAIQDISRLTYTWVDDYWHKQASN